MSNKDKDFEALMNSVFGTAKGINRSVNSLLNSNTRRTSNQVSDDVLSMQEELNKLKQNSSASEAVNMDVLRQNANALSADIEALSKANGMTDDDFERIQREIQKDFGISASDPAIQKKLNATEKLSTDFTGVLEELNKVVIGQETYNKQLITAFKRPTVMGKGEYCLNTILITGASSYGKHTSVEALAEILKNHNILATDKIAKISCERYSSNDNEMILNQDLYSALRSDASIILVENFEKINTGFISLLSDFVDNGEIVLNKRYVVSNKQQLVDTNNNLVDNAISTMDAKDKYIVFISDTTEKKIANQFSVNFVNSFNDRLVINNVFTEENVRDVVKLLVEKLVMKCQSTLSMDVAFDESFNDYIASAFKKDKGMESLQDKIDESYKGLSSYKLMESVENNCKIIVSYDEKLIIRLEGTDIDLSAYMPVNYTTDVEEVKKQLDKIVGLKEVKKYILALEDNYNIMKRRREQGRKVTEVSKHMIFTGNPGTGKTTIARLISQYLKAIGILSGGQLVEVTRQDLVGRYVGHTAPLTNKVIQSAIGGVLFIDEAYSLYRGKDDSFGLEAIDTIVKGIEDNRDNLVVILAGYTKEMNEFLTANSGLKSRFPNIIEFPDYTPEEMVEIAKITAKDKDYVINELVFAPLQAYFLRKQMEDSMTNGNGRLVRNKVEQAILNQSTRVLHDENAALDELTLEDFDFE